MKKSLLGLDSWIAAAEEVRAMQFGHHGLKTTEIGIRTPLKSENYFRFVSQTTGVEGTTFLSRVQNLVKIGKELAQAHRRKLLIDGSIQYIG